MAAEGAVSFLLHKFDYLINREWSLLSGINNEVDGLRHEFETISAFLIEAAIKGESNEQVRVWIKHVQDLAYDIEDALDMFAFHMAQQVKLIPEFLRLKRRHSIANSIQDINTKLRGVKETRERYHVITSGPGTSSSDPGNNAYIYPRVASLFVGEADTVGIEEPRNKLISWAAEGQPKLEVMFVVGMGGVGKTLLAKKVYEGIKEDFDCCAWITISKSDRKEVLLWTMLKRFYDSLNEPTPRNFYTTSVVQLMDKLRAHLQHKRYVIVFDDLWSKDVWESIRYALPNQNHGRVIITTRRGDIAHFCCDDDYVHVYNLQPLPSEKARELFHKKIFPSSGECPPGLLEWSSKFLKQCEGLPLGIVTIGTLLSKTKRTADAWRKLHDSLGSELEINGHLSSTMKVLSVSYDDLPYYLKYCLLYFAIFPEDYPIRRRKLIRLWISEGLVKEVMGKTLEEVGDDYLKELIQRKLVLENELDFDGQAKNCRVHRLLHKIILSKAQEENFCRVSTESEMSVNEKVRRLSIHRSFYNMLQKKFPRARSLFTFGIEMLPVYSFSQTFRSSLGILKVLDWETILSSFSILKVLDLEGAPLEEFPAAITSLSLLRYLSLRNTSIRKVPRSIGNLRNLETLDLKQTFITELPKKIFKLDKLRHLLVYHCSIKNYVTIDCVQGFKASARIGRLVALQKLSFINANRGDEMISALGNLTQLRKLGIINLKEEDGKHLCHSIEKMKTLQSLVVTSTGEEELLDLNAMPTPPMLLERLYLKGRLQKLPNWISSLHDLVRIRLMWSKLESNPIDALQDLPNLMELQFLDAYSGKQLVFGPGKFQNLKILDLEKLEALELVKMHGGTLACLEKLIIKQCGRLELVPEGIDNLVVLKEFHLYDMPEKLVNGLQRNGGQFRQLVHHIPLICSYSLEDVGYWRPTDLS